METNFSNFIEVLSYRAKHSAEDSAFVFLKDGEKDEVIITYKELYDAAVTIGIHLHKSTHPGDRILLFYPPGLEFIKAFYGCMFAGVIAVPSYPPRMNKTIDRLQTIMVDCDATVILTESGVSGIDRIQTNSGNKYEIIYTDILESFNADECHNFNYSFSEIAFLQYTSGSTGSPKGVIITHTNILSNQALIKSAFNQTEKSVIVGWLPFYHDMGLIGNILHPVYLGAKAILMSPIHFLQKPVRWLQAISNYKATTSGGPNFAYELCVNRVSDEDRKHLDLSSWKVAFCGAEPVRATTLERFLEHFNVCGFDSKSFQPCYGMAEATLLISAHKNQSEIEIKSFTTAALTLNADATVWIDRSSGIVSCGIANGFAVKIVGTDGIEKEDSNVGEIWIKGTSVATGYWNKPLINKEVFSAYTSNSDGPYFKTGDLGILLNGKLYITGRLKDLIILNGRNLYPQDLESVAAESHEALIHGSCAAFTVENEIVLVCEVDERKQVDFALVLKNIKTALFEYFEIDCHKIVLIKRGSISKTTSGKIQRYACRNNYVNEELTVIYRFGLENEKKITVPSFETDTQKKIHRILKEFILEEDIGLVDNFFTAGMDSLKISSLAIKLNKELKVDIETIFDYPTIKSLAEQIDSNEIISNNSLLKVSDDACYEATSTQKGIWIDTQLNPHSSAYNIFSILDLDESHTFIKIQESFNFLIKKYEILRTSFIEQDGLIYQNIADHCEFQLDSLLFYNVQQDQYRNFVSEFKAKIFDLERSPLFKAAFVICEGKNKLLLLMHHSIGDGSTIKMLFEEILSNTTIESVNINPVKFQFKDFSEWMRLSIDSKEGQEARHYWINELKEPPVKIDLPYDDSETTNKKGASEFLTIEEDIFRKLESVSRENKVTLFVTLTTAFFILLHRLSGEEDVVIGTPINLRDTAELSAMQGPLVNMVFLRNQLDKNSNFKELLLKIQEKIINASRNKFYPVANIIEELGVKSVPGKFPLSQVFFNFLNFVSNEEEAGSYQNCEGLDVNYFINCYVVKLDDKLSIRVDYRSALFDKETIQNILIKYKNILESISSDANQTYNEIELGTALPDILLTSDAFWYAAETHIQDVISNTFSTYKDRFAVVDNDIKYTYKDLDVLTLGIATILKPYANKNVIIFIPLGYQTPISILSCILSGAVYCYVNVDTPEERLKYIFEELNPAAVITSEKSAEKLHASLQLKSCTTIYIEDYLLCKNSIDSAYVNSTRTDLLYILYTSGTTGQPKGVMQTGDALMHYISSYSAFIKMNKEDNVSGITSPSYDSFNKDFFSSFFSGATYFPGDVKELTDPLVMFQWLEGNEISVWQVTPILFRYFANAWKEDKRILSKVRIVKMTGDAVRANDFNLFKEVTLPDAEFIVSLGSTESSLNTINKFSHSDSIKTKNVSVGYPINRTNVIVSDTVGKELGVLEKGELCVSSKYLSLGYYKNDKATAEKFFVKDGQRFLRTGDLVRKLVNGKVEWLGRNETILKVHGNRISLKNLDEYISLYSGITDSYSILKSEDDDDIIVSYIVHSNDIDLAILKEFLRKKLPDYNISNLFISMDRLPLNIHGKIDSNKLPHPEKINKPIGAEYEVLLNPTETQLIKIWKKVLNQSHIEVTDDFFTIGGNSIKAIKLTNSINAYFETNIAVNDIFSYSTVKSLSLHLSQVRKLKKVFIRAEEKEYYDLTNAQLRIWIQSQLVPFNINNAFVVSGDLNVETLKDSILLLAQRHDSLRTQFTLQEGYPKQRFVSSENFVLDYTYTDVSHIVDQGSLIKEIYDKEINHEFNIEKDSLFKITVLKCSEGKYILFNTIHHVISDGWSMEIFTRDLIRIYTTLTKNEKYLIASLDVQFKDYVETEKEYFKSDQYRIDKAYWGLKFRNGIPRLNLPLDRPRHATVKPFGSIFEFSLQEKINKSIVAYSKQKNISSFVTLIAALKILFFKYLNQGEIVLGTMVAGRGQSEWEQQIGMYAKTLILKTDLLSDQSFDEVVYNVLKTNTEALEHNNYPIDELAEQLKIQKDSLRPMFFDVMVILHNTGDILNEIKQNTHLDFQILPQGSTIAKFDLTFNIYSVNDAYHIKVEYNTSIFDSVTINILIDKFNILLGQVFENSVSTLADISIKTQTEKSLDNKKVDISFNF